MALLDWSQCQAVESIVVFDNLEAGATIDEIVEWFDVTPEQVKAVIEFAARSLEAPVLAR